MDFTIQHWAEHHGSQVRTMIRGFLQIGHNRGGDLEATDNNINLFWQLGLSGAKRGEPCLVAVVNDEVVSYICWMGIPTQLDARWKTMDTHGAFTLGKYRHSGVATALRERAQVIAKELGYNRITGWVHAANDKGMYYFREKGAKVCAVQFELLI